jgi:hypothetical protein
MPGEPMFGTFALRTVELSTDCRPALGGTVYIVGRLIVYIGIYIYIYIYLYIYIYCMLGIG